MEVTDCETTSSGPHISVVSSCGPDPESMVPGPCASRPANNVWVNKSGRVHVGDKISHNIIQNETVTKGRFLGLELRSRGPKGRCRCSTLVFVCWGSLVACVLCVVILHYLIPRPRLLGLDIKESWYLRRADWQAMPAYSMEYLTLPLRTVLVGHSATAACASRYECVAQVMAIQQDHLRRSYFDIGPNFLIGGGGLVFEGRGANVCGSMLRSYNRRSISVMFVGDYRTDPVDEEQLKHMHTLLARLVDKGVLSDDYKIYGKCQFESHTYSPGARVMEVLNQFPNWNPVNASYCLEFKPSGLA